MTKAILIILTLAGFASGAEMEVTDRLSVVSTAVFSGNVGIGTAVPNSRLQVVSSTGTAYILTAGTSTAYSLVLSTTGNVGVGTSNPAGKLQVIGNIYQGNYKVMDTSMADNFTVQITSNVVKIADRIEQNTALLAFKMAVSDGLTRFNMVNGMMDEFYDETGVDTANSTGQTYNSTDKYYMPTLGGYDTYTNLVIHFDGATGDKPTPAATGQTITYVGTAQVSTAEKEFGAGSLLLDGSSYVTVPNEAGLNFGTGIFTIDFWFKRTGGYPQVVGQFIDHYNRWYCIVYATGDVVLFCCISGGTSVYITAAVGAIDTNWHHFAISRVNSDNAATGWRFFLDGNSQALTLMGGSWQGNLTVATDFKIGEHNGDYTTGYTDEFRVSKGIARWTTNFSVPTSPYVPSPTADMVLLSNATTAEAEPNHARFVLFEQDVDAVAVNTDIKTWVSIDNGTTYDQVTMSDEGDYNSTIRILSGTADVSTRTGTNIKWKVTTHNAKNLKLHGVGLNWD